MNIRRHLTPGRRHAPGAQLGGVTRPRDPGAIRPRDPGAGAHNNTGLSTGAEINARIDTLFCLSYFLRRRVATVNAPSPIIVNPAETGSGIGSRSMLMSPMPSYPWPFWL